MNIIGAATKFQAARFKAKPQNHTAEQLWAAFRDSWIRSYVCSLKVLRFDQGSSPTTALLQIACAMNGIRFGENLTEAPWHLGTIERAYSPFAIGIQQVEKGTALLDSGRAFIDDCQKMQQR